jgi:hypothetical protein
MHHCRTATEELQFKIKLSGCFELLVFTVEFNIELCCKCFVYLTRNSRLVTLPLQAEICALLGCYAESSDNPSPTFRDNVSVPFLRAKNPKFLDFSTLVGLVLQIIEVSWSHSDTPHSVGLLWTSARPVAETSTWQHTTDRHPWPWLDSNPQT